MLFSNARSFFTPAAAFRLSMLASSILAASWSLSAGAASGSCATSPVTTAVTGTCLIDSDNDSVTVDVSGSISATGTGVRIAASSPGLISGVTLTNSGAIEGTGSGGYGVHAISPSGLDIVNRTDGRITSAQSFAIAIDNNSGLPYSASVINDGLISGVSGINAYGSSGARAQLMLINSGTVRGIGSSAIETGYADISLLSNTGITSSDSGTATIHVRYQSTLSSFANGTAATIENTASNGRAFWSEGSDVGSFVNDGFMRNSSNVLPTVHIVSGTVGSLTNGSLIQNLGNAEALYIAPTVASAGSTVVRNNAGATISSQQRAVMITNAADLGNFINAGSIIGNFSVGTSNSLRTLTIGGNESALFNGMVDLVTSTATPGVDGGDLAFVTGSRYAMLGDQHFRVRNFNLDGGTLILDPRASNRTVGTAATVLLPTISGNLIGADGQLEVVVVNNTTYGQLAVEGDVDLTDTTLAVNVQANGLLSAGNLFADVISSTGAITYGNFSISDNSALWDFDTIRNASDLDLRLTADGQGESSTSTGGSGGSGGSGTPSLPNSGNVITAAQVTGNTTAQGVAPVIQSVADDYAANGSTGSSQLDSMILALGNYSTAAGLADGVATLAPASVHSGREAAQANRRMRELIGRRDAYLYALNPETATAEPSNVWAQPFGSRARQQQRSGVEGYDVDSYGVLLGMDGGIDDVTELGVAFGIGRSDIDSNMSVGGYESELNSYQLLGYLNRELGNDVVLGLTAGLGYAEYETDRDLFNGMTARSEYDTWTASAGAELKKHYAVNEQFDAAVQVGLSYDYTDVDGYSESGAGALNLDVDGTDYQSLNVEVGTELAYDLGDGWMLFGQAGVSYDALAEQAKLDAVLVGTGDRFATRGIDADAWRYDAGLGGKYVVDNGAELAALYSVSCQSGFVEQAVTLNARMAF